jgi:hypothetical protein
MAYWLTPVLALGIFAAPAQAQQVQVFNDRAAFNSAAGAQLDTQAFEDLSDGSPFQALTYGRATFHSTDGDPQDLVAHSPDTLPFPAVQSRTLFSNRNFNPMVVDFDPAVTAVGADVLQVVDGDGVVVTVEGSDGTQSFPVSYVAGGPAFVGFVASAGTINRVTVSNPAGVQQFVGVDNVSYGDAPQGGGGGEEEGDLKARFERLAAAIVAGTQDGSIRRIGPSLLAKVKLAWAAVERGRHRNAVRKLQALARELRVQRGRRITAARANELLALTDDCTAGLR